MKTFPLAATGLTVPAVIAGMMRIPDMTDDGIRTLVRTALDHGITFFDHADIYGTSYHHCEARFGQAVTFTPAEREQVILQTKCGIAKGPDYENTGYDFSHDYILRQVEGSLKALGTDYIDILLLHRPDALVEPEEVAAAFDELHSAGKVRYFGVSNHTPGQIELLKAYVRQPIVVNQVQLSLTHSPLVAQGLAMNIGGSDQSLTRDIGLLDYCRLNGITLQAWSPFQSGYGPGVFLDNPAYPELNALLADLAKAYGVTPMGIATAWITRHPANIQVVTGTTNPGRIAEVAAGADVTISRAEWYALFSAAGHIIP